MKLKEVAMPNGYNGKILHVDLTEGTLTVEEPD
jgi:aldehyde:ferredoxin oxidoreductase